MITATAVVKHLKRFFRVSFERRSALPENTILNVKKISIVEKMKKAAIWA
jgi:hypothetical protein